MEQRRKQRFPIIVPIEITKIAGHRVSRLGQTVNVGSGGVLFSTDKKIEPGSRLEYLVTLIDFQHNVRIRCLGRVVRIVPPPGSEPDAPWHIAVTIDRYEFLAPNRTRVR